MMNRREFERLAPACLSLAVLVIAALGLAGCRPPASVTGFTPPPGAEVCTSSGSSLEAADCSLWLKADSPDANDSVQGWVAGIARPVAVNAITANGLSAGYMVSATDPPDPLTPSSPDCFTCGITSQLASTVKSTDHPDIQAGISGLFSHAGTTYAVLTVQDPDSPVFAVDHAARPGAGVDNDIYIAQVEPDGGLGRYWRVYRLPDLGLTDGLIWPEVNGAGTEIVWSEMYAYFAPLGAWQLDDARVIWADGVPTLGPTASYPNERPGVHSGQEAFYEPYGFTPAGDILFSSSLGHYGLTGNMQTEDQIYTVDPTFSHRPVAVSDGQGDDEFAFFYDADHIVYGGTTTQVHPFWRWGLDWWVQAVDPVTEVPIGPPQLLTGFNRVEYADVGGWAVDPANPHHILFSVCEGAHQTLLTACDNADLYSMTVGP